MWSIAQEIDLGDRSIIIERQLETDRVIISEICTDGKFQKIVMTLDNIKSLYKAITPEKEDKPL